MASSQVACVNFLLPLAGIPGALLEALRAIDDDVTGIIDIAHEGNVSPVEFEWVGLGGSLEGMGPRGANATSVDAFLVAETATGWRRAYLLEWEYVEQYLAANPDFKGRGSHIRGILENFLANIPRDEAYHGLQKRGSNAGAVRSPDEVMQDPHLEDRRFWTDVEYPELGKTFRHPGPAAIFNGSPWRISRRAPLIGEHNEEVLCGELGLFKAELAVLAEGGSV